MSLVRSFRGCLGIALACAACGEPAPLPQPGNLPEDDAGPPDPPPTTLETLGGTLYTPGNANVAWAYTFPGEHGSPPELMRGPGTQLMAKVTIERRPKPTNKLLQDVFLMRFDADSGALEWMKPVDPYARHTIDTHGNVILVWPTRTTKFDPDGSVLWSKDREPAGAYEVVSVATDGHDNVMLARIELDAATNEIGADPKGFVVLDKLDADGDLLWSKRFGDGTSGVSAAWVASDPDDNVVLLAAYTDGPFDFGGGPLDDEDVLAKFDPNGGHVFSKAFAAGGPSGYQSSSPVLTDARGNIVLRTESIGEIDIGLGPVFCIRYVLKFDPSGAPLWNQCINSDNLALEASGGLLLTSTVTRNMAVGDVECDVLEQDREGSEGMLARYDSSGDWVATQCAEDPSYQFFGAPTADPSGMFFMSAAFMNQVTLPDASVVPALDDWYTAVIAKVNLGG